MYHEVLTPLFYRIDQLTDWEESLTARLIELRVRIADTERFTSESAVDLTGNLISLQIESIKCKREIARLNSHDEDVARLEGNKSSLLHMLASASEGNFTPMKHYLKGCAKPDNYFTRALGQPIQMYLRNNLIRMSRAIPNQGLPYIPPPPRVYPVKWA